ncbi:MAG TPA: hypothetical protein VHC20_05950 [Candidatus Paceibacterota bacterium]|nr:hypothetical protein [Candidatus Paceibacterota bacterium]
MSFADEAEKEKRAGYLGRGCGVGAMLDRLDPSLREEVTAVLKDRPDIPATAIRKALVKSAETYAGRTFSVPSAYTFVRHRRGDCNCESAT